MVGLQSAGQKAQTPSGYLSLELMLHCICITDYRSCLRINLLLVLVLCIPILVQSKDLILSFWDSPKIGISSIAEYLTTVSQCEP